VIAQNASALEREAHSLKSSAGIFGFRALSAKAAEIELNARKIDGNVRTARHVAASGTLVSQQIAVPVHAALLGE